MTDTIHIPRSAFVSCPLKKFAQTRVDKCPGCPHFKGFVDTTQGTGFEERYYVQCAAPMTRRIHRIEVD